MKANWTLLLLVLLLPTLSVRANLIMIIINHSIILLYPAANVYLSVFNIVKQRFRSKDIPRVPLSPPRNRKPTGMFDLIKSDAN